MKANIVFTLDGKISIITQEGDFDGGEARIKALIAALEAEGIDIDLLGAIEQHRHDDEGNHVHSHNQAKA